MQYFQIKIFDHRFNFIVNEKDTYVGFREIGEFLGKNNISKHLPVDFQILKIFKMVHGIPKLNWNTKFIRYEDIALVTERTRCCKSKKIILSRGLRWVINRDILKKEPWYLRDVESNYLEALHTFPNFDSDITPISTDPHYNGCHQILDEIEDLVKFTRESLVKKFASPQNQ